MPRVPVRVPVAIGASSTLALVALGAFATSPERVERLYVRGVAPHLHHAWGALFQLFPGSAAELVELGAIAFGLAFVGVVVRELWRARGRRRAVLGLAAAWAWALVAPVLLLFYALWGLAYARPPAEQRLGWVEPGAEVRIEADELAALSEELVDRVNELYLELHGWPDDLAPTTARRSWLELDREIDRGYERVAAEMGLEPDLARSRGPAKSLLTSGVFTWLGIGGFYFPFTGEANINVWSPDWQRPHTVAHEKAHQRFVASENEANFYGFLATIHADDPFVRYGGWLFAQRQVLQALQRTDPLAAGAILAERLPGVQRDVNAAHAFWTGYDGPLERLGDRVNDTYLRANAVKGGIRSYSQSVELVVLWHRAQGRIAR
jgi:hypothetical protein